jgi:hypothetical protein
MPSLLDDGRIVFPLQENASSVKESARRCGFEFPLSLRHFLNTPTPECPFLAGVRLHLKVLQEPTVPISTMLRCMQLLYSPLALTVEVVSRQDLRGPVDVIGGVIGRDDLLDLDVGPCETTQALTAEQTELYRMSDNVDDNHDIVVYFVRQVLENNTKTLNGCASPTSKLPPNIAIAQTASRWTLAHEVCHWLGLNHITGESVDCPPDGPPDCCNNPDTTRLMTGCGTDLIPQGTIPTLDRTEQDKMISGPLIQNF